MKLELTENAQKDKVVNFLLETAKKDELLANNINKCPDKNFDKCWDYIVAKAKTQAVDGCSCISDSEVYQWAKDYFNDYEIREAQKKAKEEESKAKILNDRRANILQTVKDLKVRLNGYPELLKKYNSEICGLVGELEAKLSKEDRLNEISNKTKTIYEEINALEESEKVEAKQEVKEEQEEESYDLFNFI